MTLHFEVSPSEAGTVVDGLSAQGFATTEVNMKIGDERATVAVADLSEAQVEEVRDMMLVLATDAREVDSEE